MTHAYAGFRYPEWQHQAACRPSVIPPVWQEWAESPLQFFYPVGEDARSLPSGWRAAIREVCGSCPVRQECYDHALAHEVEGYWAATGPHHRRKKRLRLHIPTRIPERDPDNHGQTIGTFYPSPHGSDARYRRHLREGEPACDACREGHRLAREEEQAALWDAWKRNTTLEERRAARHQRGN